MDYLGRINVSLKVINPLCSVLYCLYKFVACKQAVSCLSNAFHTLLVTEMVLEARSSCLPGQQDKHKPAVLSTGCGVCKVDHFFLISSLPKTVVWIYNQNNQSEVAYALCIFWNSHDISAER